jgi:chromate transport protein ChrA
VERRKWLSEEAFVDLVALCQFLPGPTSSQVCYSIGMTRGCIAGAIATWGGFHPTVEWTLKFGENHEWTRRSRSS